MPAPLPTDNMIHLSLRVPAKTIAQLDLLALLHNNQRRHYFVTHHRSSVAREALELGIKAYTIHFPQALRPRIAKQLRHPPQKN